MASPMLLDAAIKSDGSVREAPYTLMCMVAAVEKVSEGSPTKPRDIITIYSLQKGVIKDVKDKNDKENIFDEEEIPSALLANSMIEETDLKRLLNSTTIVETRKRLGEQLKQLKAVKIRELTGVSLPKHLQIAAIEEDQLEFRRDTHGVAIIRGRNVLGERYAHRSKPLSFLHGHSVPEIFQRMRRIVREDLSTRNQRRIAALNAKEKQRQKELELQGILSPEQQLEAKLDRLFHSAAAS